MSGIFGLFQRDGAPASRAALDTMRAAMPEWGPDGFSTWIDGSVGLGQARFFDTPEAHLEKLPAAPGVQRVAFTAAARLDYRDELAREISIPGGELERISDGELLRRAWLAWNGRHLERIHGDWSAVAWYPVDNRLVLARDPYGITALYYAIDSRRIAFASSRQALLALDLEPRKLDDLYIAQVVVAWTPPDGSRTAYESLRRLPPAHTLEVTRESVRARCYWRLEEQSEARQRSRAEYVEGLRSVFDDAVRTRIRGHHVVAANLSGGLDSSSVVATAAELLRDRGGRVHAFTSVPRFDTTPFMKSGYGDESSRAQITARACGNVGLALVDGAAWTPIAAMRRAIAIHGEPMHSAGNLFWLLQLHETASAGGCRVLLNGQRGNAGLSWGGRREAFPLRSILRHLGARAWLSQLVRRSVPLGLQNARAYRKGYLQPDQWPSALHPDLDRRLRVRDQMKADPLYAPTLTRETHKARLWLGGRTHVGGLYAEQSAAHGISVRDPTADIRLIAFTNSVPDDVCMNLATGQDRWLVREAMAGRIPDEVRLDTARGRQAADLVPRLRETAAEVTSALDEVCQGPGANYVDPTALRTAWHRVQTESSLRAHLGAVTILTRGLMAGLFVNQFHRWSAQRTARLE